MEIIYISLDKIFPPKPKTKELSNNLFGQTFVPVVDDETNIQTGDGFCLNRRQLLSVTYLSEIRHGEHEPIYIVVQQATINYLKSFGSNFELQICLSKADDDEEHVEVDDILYFDGDLQILSGKEDEVRKRTTYEAMNNNENYVIEALPLSYQLSVAPPSNPKTTVMQNNKQWRAARPYITRKRKNAPAAEKVAELGNLDWLKDWVIEARQRKSGRYDYFYYHKRIKLMCRSLVEVHNFHFYGVLPRRGVKRLVQRSIQQRPIIQVDASTVNQNVNEEVAKRVPPEPKPKPKPEPKPKPVMKKKTSSKKRTFNYYSSSSSADQSVSEMLKEAYDNLLMSNSSGSSTTFVQTCSNDDDNNQPQPPISVEDFLRDSYNNLNNTPPNPNSSESSAFMDKKYVEDFLKDSYNNLLNTTPIPKSSKGYKKRKVAEKSTEEGTGHEDVIMIN